MVITDNQRDTISNCLFLFIVAKEVLNYLLGGFILIGCEAGDSNPLSFNLAKEELF